MSHENKSFGFDIGSNIVVETTRKIYLHATDKLFECAIVLGCFLLIFFLFSVAKKALADPLEDDLGHGRGALDLGGL